MEKNGDQKLQTADKFDKYQFLKKTLRLVLSVSLFSLFLCYSSGFICFFPHSFSIYFSTSLFSIFTNTLERKYMFLICNGIVAILAKISVSCSSSPSETDLRGEYSDSDVLAMNASAVDEDVRVRSTGSAENVAFVAEREQELAEAEKLEEEEEDGSSNTEKEERGSEAFIAEDEGKKEEDDEEANDELNKKIEEFIRKMKEEIRIEAQRQLIAV